jgi:predicted Fe-Mo cluster-binding NifX family protein
MYMKVAVTYEDGNVFQHFGHTEQFKIYEISDGKITGSEVTDTGGSGHEALAGFLKNSGVTELICGGIGGGAKTALAEAGITLYGGVTGSADDAVKALLAGSLAYDSGVTCSHHEHGEGHSCGSHTCGHGERG